jgi:hypothetical protein
VDERFRELRQKDFRDELERIWQLATGERRPMVLMRFGDGEGLLMRGQEVHHETQAYQVDGWSAPEGITRLGRDLLAALSMVGPDVHIGISDLSRWPAEMAWALERTRQPATNITFACLFINANYPVFRTKLIRLSEPVVLMVSERAPAHAALPFKVIERFPMPIDCANRWEQDYGSLGAAFDALAERHQSTLFLISGGPLAKVAAGRMWERNSSNRYLDVGSAIDEFVFGRLTRPDYVEGGRYSTFDPRRFHAQHRKGV